MQGCKNEQENNSGYRISIQKWHRIENNTN